MEKSRLQSLLRLALPEKCIGKLVFTFIAAAVAFGCLYVNPGYAATKTIKIGHVSPKTGPLAAFAEADKFVLAEMRKILANGIEIGGVKYPVVIIEKDSQSNSNRAAEVTEQLIKRDKVDLVLAAHTSDTTNPVSDQCELNQIPCITTDAPWQAYFFGRSGDPKKGFDWTYHFFWGLEDIIAAYTNLWNSIPTNKVVGTLFPNDSEGNAWGDPKMGFPPELTKQGFKYVDSGRFRTPANDYTAQISTFKKAGVEIVTGVLPPPDFTTFWTQAQQQGFHPKIVTVAKALLFPASVEALGKLGNGLSSEVWWSPNHPYKSSLTGKSCKTLATEFSKSSGKQWTQPLGFKYALFEVAIDVLKRTKDINSPSSIRDAIVQTNYNSIVGTVSWANGPVKNVSKTKIVAGQWGTGSKFKYDLTIVNNKSAPEIPAAGTLKPMKY